MIFLSRERKVRMIEKFISAVGNFDANVLQNVWQSSKSRIHIVVR